MQFDHTLTSCKHIESISGKVRTKNNLIGKLPGSTWVCDADILRATTAFALIYSAAEYYSPIWAHSTHTKKLDIELDPCLSKITEKYPN